MPEHILAPRYLEHEVRVDLVGCGGNGSQMLTGLARLDRAMRALGHPGLEVTAWDPDLVSEANVGRQLFSPSDVGLNKAVVLVHRLNAYYGLAWDAHPERFKPEAEAKPLPLVVSCVDSAAARIEIAGHLKYVAANGYWMDLGNRASDGQVVLGQTSGRHRKREPGDPIRLPTVLDLFWEVRSNAVAGDDTPSCSLAEALERQELFINQAVVTQALAILWTLFRFGRIAWHGAFVNLRTGRTQPLPVDPQVWALMGYHHTTQGKGKKK